MAVITISVTGSTAEVISGVPRFVELTTNLPSTIFYTVDGTEPTSFSSVYLEQIELPTSGTIRLRALAISGSDTGRLDITFATDTTDLRQPRRSSAVLGGGIVVDAYDVVDVLTDGYSPDADNVVDVASRSSDYALQDLEIKFSKTGPGGEGPGTLIPIGFPVGYYERPSAINVNASSPNNNNVFFNPKSLYIVIDGTTDDQVFDEYKMINRPTDGTLDLTKYLQGKSLYEPQPYISGGLVRTYYNRQTGIFCSYYWDSCETRWIKSIQRFDPAEVPRNVGLRPAAPAGTVFKWIYNKRSAI